MFGLYASSLAALEETLQSFVPKRLDHPTKCSLLRIAQQAAYHLVCREFESFLREHAKRKGPRCSVSRERPSVSNSRSVCSRSSVCFRSKVGRAHWRRWSSDGSRILDFQYLCGEQYFTHAPPIHPSSLSRRRQKIGEVGGETLLAETIEVGIKTRTVKKSSVKRVTGDTPVQEKAVTSPTDAREHLGRLARQHGLRLRQSAARVGPRALRKVAA